MKRITGKAAGSKRHFWGCSAQTADPQSCTMRREQEQGIKNAFATMLNKLAFMPLADLYIELLTAEEAETAGPEAAAIREKEKSIHEEKDRLTLLLQKGCGEPVLFRERIAALETGETALQKEVERISGESLRMREAKDLKRVVSTWKSGRTTDTDQIFTEIADHATVITGESVTFHLKCGLELMEMLSRSDEQ